MNHQERINVFNPFVEETKMQSISRFCRQFDLGWQHLLEMSTSAVLNILLDSDSLEDQMQFSKCIDYTDKLAKHLHENVNNQWLKFRGTAYLMKSMTETMQKMGYRKPFQLEPQLKVDYFSPVTDSNAVEAFNYFCAQNLITPLEVLDTGLCWYGVDTVLADYSPVKNIALIDADRIGSGAVVAKMVNKYLKFMESTPFERVVTLLMMTKAFSASTLGVCPKQLQGEDNLEK